MSQKQDVLKHLEDGKSITPIEALSQYGCFRLADVIFRLKKDGHDIETKIIKHGTKSFAEYHLVKDDEIH